MSGRATVSPPTTTEPEDGWPAVSIIIPCYEERPFIASCLDSVLATAYPTDLLEVLVVDGMSEDGTREVLERYAREHPQLHVLDNPHRTTPAALNVGIRRAAGDVILRMDVHADYPPTYVPDLVRWLLASGADNVGGVAETRPASSEPLARAIARGLSHPFGVGNSYFRIGTSEPRWVDTVPFGCYRREVFDRIGLFDEDLVRNQDDEFNARLIRRGGRILLVPDVTFRYYPRDSLHKLWRMYHQYGLFKPLAIRKLGAVPTLRQLVPAGFVTGLGISGLLAPWVAAAAAAFGAIAGAYAIALGVACVGSAIRHRDAASVLLLTVFPTMHVAYGIGFLQGLPASLRDRDASGYSAVPLSR